MKKKTVSLEIMENIFTMYKNVKHLRERHGLSIKQFAEIIKISETKLSLSESCTDVGCFYDIHIKNICDYFKINPDDLLKKESEQKNKGWHLLSF